MWRSRRFGNNLHVGSEVEVPVAGTFDVKLDEAREAVRLDAPQVGAEQDVRRHARVLGGNAHCPEHPHREGVQLIGFYADVTGVGVVVDGVSLRHGWRCLSLP